jgi:peptidoglycan/xylan/chitin deacetylase (PgdA/CDA1 family)
MKRRRRWGRRRDHEVPMSLLLKVKDSWRKNSDELRGFWNGSLPEFVTARRPRAPQGVPVFHYHEVKSESFDAELAYLARNGYRTLSGREFVGYLSGDEKLAGDAVLLTFDDGPRNFFDVAFPLLQKYGAKAVAFIAPGLHRERSPGDETDARPMNWDEIRAIHDSGLVEFQSHTLESRFVPKWPQPAALAGCDPMLEESRRGAPLAFERDLEESRREIQSRLGEGVAVDQLAFPQYIGTTEATETARRLGFRACYWGLIPGRPVNRPGDSAFQVSRVSSEFLRRLPGKGRISVLDLVHARMESIRTGRAWRRRFPQSA